MHPQIPPLMEEAGGRGPLMEDAGGRGRQRSTSTAVERPRSTAVERSLSTSTATVVERPRSTSTATVVERPRSTAVERSRSTSTATVVERPCSTSTADPRCSLLHRELIQNDHEAGPSMLGSQGRRRDEVNYKLKKLGLEPKEVSNEQIFPSFLSLASTKGIYDCPVQKPKERYEDTLYEEQEVDHRVEETQGETQYEDETDTESQYEETQGDHMLNVARQEKKKRGERGPTKLKKFWNEYDPNSKVNVEFNNLGQPCGLKTSRLTNFIASLVKGKEISLAYPNWSKVPQSEKDKLWNTVKFFFNIPEVQKSWVLTSARKKFKDFKSYLKIKYFDDELSLRQNIVNGCEGRIPPKQWAWLPEYWYTEKAKARSLKNKETRNNQANALHTTGSRGFAVVHDQEEIKLGRRVGRAELYCLTHTNKDGNPVDGFSATKIQDINKKLAENPSLIGEEAHEEDMYSTFFPKAKTSARHGLGLVVGGKTSEKIDQAIAAFRQSQVENKDLRRMVETLTENQKSLVENIERKCGEMVEQRCKELMVIFQASQNQNSTQQTSLEQKVEKVSKSVIARKEGTVVVKQHGPSKTTTAREEETVAVKQDKEPPSKTTTEKNDQASQAGDVKKKGKKKNEEQLKLHLEATVSKKLKMEKQEVPKIDKVKLEKAEANIVASNKGKQIIEIKAGMEVSLQSPNSMCLAAVGTVQNVDANSLGSYGKPLRDYVEVLVNYVCSKTTMLPRAHGRLKKLENAQAKCIPWPRMFINETTKAEFNHVDIYKGHDLLRQRPELYAQIPPECGLKKKRKRTSGAAMNADDRKTNSQTVDKNQNKERMELEEPEQVKDGAKM